MDAFIFPILLVGIAALLYFQIRRQKRAMNDQQKLQNSLEVGDRVMTTSGVFGTIVATKDDSVELEIADGVTTTWIRQAIRERVQTDEDSAEQDSETDTDNAETSAVEESSESDEKQKTS